MPTETTRKKPKYKAPAPPNYKTGPKDSYMKGRDVAAFRAHFELTQEKAGEMIGYTRDTFRNWEQGLKPVPKPVAMLIKTFMKDGLLPEIVNLKPLKQTMA